MDNLVMWQLGGLALSLSIIALGLMLSQRAHQREQQRRADSRNETNFQQDWLYRGLYDNLLKAAESEARKLDV